MTSLRQFILAGSSLATGNTVRDHLNNPKTGTGAIYGETKVTLEPDYQVSLEPEYSVTYQAILEPDFKVSLEDDLKITLENELSVTLINTDYKVTIECQ